MKFYWCIGDCTHKNTHICPLTTRVESNKQHGLLCTNCSKRKSNQVWTSSSDAWPPLIDSCWKPGPKTSVSCPCFLPFKNSRTRDVHSWPSCIILSFCVHVKYRAGDVPPLVKFAAVFLFSSGYSQGNMKVNDRLTRCVPAHLLLMTGLRLTSKQSKWYVCKEAVKTGAGWCEKNKSGASVSQGAELIRSGVGFKCSITFFFTFFFLKISRSLESCGSVD